MRKLLLEAGFTLIELMIVVSILGVLASIAIPAFLNYRLRARSAEAPVNLRAIASLEEAYLVGTGTYVSAAATPAGAPGSAPRTWAPGGQFETLGWRPEGDVYFQYQVATNGTSLSFVAAARADLDGDGEFQVWAFRTTQATAGAPAECPFGGAISIESTVQQLVRDRF